MFRGGGQRWLLPNLRDPKDIKYMRVLNSIGRVVDCGLRSEPDPRHVELILKALGLEDCKPAPSPGSKPKTLEDDSAPEDPGALEDLIAAVHLRKRRCQNPFRLRGRFLIPATTAIKIGTSCNGGRDMTVSPNQGAKRP